MTDEEAADPKELHSKSWMDGLKDLEMLHNGGFPLLREAVSKSGHMYRMALLSQKN